jgi:hypothetical protein
VLLLVSGAIAWLAVPAYVTHSHSRTPEPIDMLDRICRGAEEYFTTPRRDRAGQRLECRFPATTGCIPAMAPCRFPGSRFPPDPSIWEESPTWAALNFRIDGPHYFQYCFTSSGAGDEAEFTITAHGDLDCDGIRSTFQQTGYGERVGSGECRVIRSSGLSQSNALE